MGKRFLLGFLGVSGVLFLMAAWVYLFPEGWRGRFEQAGFAGQAEGLLRCMSGSWLTNKRQKKWLTKRDD